MRLGGYTKKSPSAPASQRALILGLVLVLHVGALIWWSTRPADAEPRSGRTREYVTYYDIATFTAAGAVILDSPEAADTTAAADTAARPDRSARP